jgi:hypothetical protein
MQGWCASRVQLVLAFLKTMFQEGFEVVILINAQKNRAPAFPCSLKWLHEAKMRDTLPRHEHYGVPLA